MTKIFKILVLGSTFFSLLHGQNLLPPVHNYDLLEYKGASKNWGLTTNKKGELFVANNQGMLHFDGERWALYKLPNGTIIRSVLSVDDRIYTGSYEEFGFWQKNKTAELEYRSLTHLIKDHTFTNEEFWEILTFKEAIYFRSFSSIYVYKNDKITVINPPQVISDFIEYNGKLIVAASNRGLYELNGAELIPLENQKILLGKMVTDIVQVNDGLLVGTKLDGCYVYDGSTLTPWRVNVNDELKSHQLNKLLKLDNDKLAFGTIKNGIYIYDRKTGISQILNKKSGLQNNTVLAMLKFEDQLWLGLDNGIARIKLNNAITYFTDNTGALGMVYDMAFHNGRLYLGSNTGVFYFDDNELSFVNGSQGHVWDLDIVDGDLICGHNTGTYLITDEEFKKISSVSGGYEIVKVPEQPNRYMQGTYNGMVVYERGASGAWQVYPVSGLSFPVKQLCFESPSILWAAHPYKGFYRVHLDDSTRTVTKIEPFNGPQDPSKYNVKLYKIKNQIILYIAEEWFKYDTILAKIVPFVEFQRFNHQDLLGFHEDYFWFVDNGGKKNINRSDLKHDSLTIADLSLKQRLIPDSQKLINFNDSTSYITLGDGFAKIDINNLQRHLGNSTLPIPEFVYVHDREGVAHEFQDGPIRLGFKESRVLDVGFATPKLIQPRYSYRLVGAENHKGYVEEGEIGFQNLGYGDYELSVCTVGIDNQVSAAKTIVFQIAPPWYLSKWSIILYMFMTIMAVSSVRWYNRKKLGRKRQELEKQMQREQQKRLAELEKEKLAKEVKLKQNELASTALNIARKNEMILELKNMLVLNKDKFPNSQRYRWFMSKLNNSVKDNDDWKRFEVSFKELHEDFFERLLASYPKLTPKDLKLCAYLKMNLSTKEIAPLMAITVRGVEIHRYRLRKKLNLESSKNLSKFLITFS